MELKAALEYGIRGLKNFSSNPYQETVFILRDILACDDSYFILHLDEPLSIDQKNQFIHIINERKLGKPLAYIINRADFMDWQFYVNEDVLIPRFDTERSVEAMLPMLESTGKKFLEIGVGSGAVILSLALIHPSNTYHGIDISHRALEVARKNRSHYQLSQVELWQSDLFDKVEESYDIIYSNPPYISSLDMENLNKSVKDYEPALALHGGIDGLDFYRKIIKQGRNYLNKDGQLVFEIGYDQGKDLEELLARDNYRDIKIINDYQGHPRVVLARKGV